MAIIPVAFLIMVFAGIVAVLVSLVYVACSGNQPRRSLRYHPGNDVRVGIDTHPRKRRWPAILAVLAALGFFFFVQTRGRVSIGAVEVVFLGVLAILGLRALFRERSGTNMVRVAPAAPLPPPPPAPPSQQGTIMYGPHEESLAGTIFKTVATVTVAIVALGAFFVVGMRDAPVRLAPPPEPPRHVTIVRPPHAPRVSRMPEAPVAPAIPSASIPEAAASAIEATVAQAAEHLRNAADHAKTVIDESEETVRQEIAKIDARGMAPRATANRADAPVDVSVSGRVAISHGLHEVSLVGSQVSDENQARKMFVHRVAATLADAVQAKRPVDLSDWSPSVRWIDQNEFVRDEVMFKDTDDDPPSYQMQGVVDLNKEKLDAVYQQFSDETTMRRTFGLLQGYAGTVLILGGMAIFLRLGTGRKPKIPGAK